MKLQFDSDECRILRILADHYHKGDSMIDDPFHLAGVYVSKEFIKRIKTYEMIEYTSNTGIKILPRLVQVIEELDTTPPVDYWKSTVSWWFSSKWRVCITIVVVIIPWVVQTIQGINAIKKWFSGE